MSEGASKLVSDGVNGLISKRVSKLIYMLLYTSFR